MLQSTIVMKSHLAYMSSLVLAFPIIVGGCNKTKKDDRCTAAAQIAIRTADTEIHNAAARSTELPASVVALRNSAADLEVSVLLKNDPEVSSVSRLSARRETLVQVCQRIVAGEFAGSDELRETAKTVLAACSCGGWHQDACE